MGRTPCLVCALAGLVALAGCSGSADRPLSATEDRLNNFGSAYLDACAKLNRAPKKFEEIKPYLRGDVPAEYLRSPGDGEDFVVHWGVDFSKLESKGADPYYVGAYERTGANGKRYVLRFPRSVVVMTDDELKKATFPPGHKPPF